MAAHSDCYNIKYVSFVDADIVLRDNAWYFWFLCRKNIVREVSL